MEIHSCYYLLPPFSFPFSSPTKSKFVAAFASSNLGDVSPNTHGPKCVLTGLECDFAHSTCPNVGGVEQHCIANGPGRDMAQSTEIIGTMQAEKVSL